MFIGRNLDNSLYGAWTSLQANDAFHPRQEEVADDHPDLLAFLAPKPPRDLSDLDNIEKGLKALALCIAQVGGLTPAEMKVLFKVKWDALP
jgi:hypothetical protein